MRKSNDKLTGIILIILSICICALTTKETIKDKLFLNKAMQTSGTIIDVEENISRKSSNGTSRTYFHYTANVQYVVDGKEYTAFFTEKLRRYFVDPVSPFVKGSTITVYYDPMNPHNVMSDVDIDGFSFAFSYVLIIGVILFIKGKREENNYIAL